MLLSFSEFYLTRDRFVTAGFPVKNIQKRIFFLSKNIAEPIISFEPAESFIRREEGKLVISLTSRLPSIFAKEISTF